MLPPDPGVLIHNWRFDKGRVALSAMGSNQRGRKGGQGFSNAKPARPLRQMRPVASGDNSRYPRGAAPGVLREGQGHIRAKVEHVFRVLKQQLGFGKTRLRGLKKRELWIRAHRGLGKTPVLLSLLGLRAPSEENFALAAAL